jgi:hypothetical protein
MLGRDGEEMEKGEDTSCRLLREGEVAEKHENRTWEELSGDG